ncbi:hypothetical protein Pint_18531 [Pistacia integerrima]|uniref:Uncharacterized protein n=1 Tax=Pistacia integerrima TaxID=434235 RepID=A0ACC0YYA4_9ROSI|nr:hypothetical protein Pint_18531 [Pistacia integerrima]
MPLSTPFNPFMARKKSRASTTDELSIIKAAAWAWYQHGSGSERKPMGEFDITRTRRQRKPSLYKLEAMKITEEEDHSNTQPSSQSSSPVHDNKSLLDPYEIESISKRLDQLMENSSVNKFYDDRKKVSRDGDHDSGGNVRKKKSNKLRGFWQPVLCGRREDIAAADTRFVGGWVGLGGGTAARKGCSGG